MNLSIAKAQLAVGFCAALGAGVLALKIVKRTLLREKFNRFGYYCLGVALLSLLV